MACTFIILHAQLRSYNTHKNIYFKLNINHDFNKLLYKKQQNFDTVKNTTLPLNSKSIFQNPIPFNYKNWRTRQNKKAPQSKIPLITVTLYR